MMSADDLKRLEEAELRARTSMAFAVDCGFKGNGDAEHLAWLCAKLRSSNDALERVCEVRGTMECPLCGHDQPHNHDKWIGVDLDGTLAVSFHDHQKVVARN